VDTHFFFHDSVGKLKFYDAVNLSSAADINYNTGKEYIITANYGEHPDYTVPKLQITVESDTTVQGSLRDFVGSFNPVDFLFLSRYNPHAQYIKHISFKKEPEWI